MVLTSSEPFRWLSTGILRPRQRLTKPSFTRIVMQSVNGVSPEVRSTQNLWKHGEGGHAVLDGRVGGKICRGLVGRSLAPGTLSVDRGPTVKSVQRGGVDWQSSPFPM